MAARSTRNKGKWQLEQAINKLDSAMVHLQKFDEITMSRSEIANKVMPEVINGIDLFKDVLVKLRKTF